MTAPLPPSVIRAMLEAQAGLGQFNIAHHYDVMEQLDADVHDNKELSRSEVQAALRLLGRVPRSVFLPCFGTGRHIEWLLKAGVKRIVGVDLSPKCVAKARSQFAGDPRVELHIGDLRTWRTSEWFEAVILLGNSFGDITDADMLLAVTQGMVDPLQPGGHIVMDYIGEGYLDRCDRDEHVTWDATYNGEAVKDERTPSYDPSTRVMRINIRVTSAASGELRWTGRYDKRILGNEEVVEHFSACDIRMVPMGRATSLNTSYYASHSGELGMIARSTWWLGTKLG